MSYNLNIMKCKYCKKDIEKGAKRCEHCQADLRNWFVRHKILTTLLVLFVLGVILSATGQDEKIQKQNTEKKVQETQQAQTDYKVKVKDIVKEFKDNAVISEEKYQNKVTEITGEVEKVNEFAGEYYVSLKKPKEQYPIEYVNCYFTDKEQLKTIKKGDVVVVKGSYSSNIMNSVMFKQCVLVK